MTDETMEQRMGYAEPNPVGIPLPHRFDANGNVLPLPLTPLQAAERRVAELEQHLRDTQSTLQSAMGQLHRAILAANTAKAEERERWRSAVMLELDSNGQAHAIVAAAIREGAPAQVKEQR